MRIICPTRKLIIAKSRVKVGAEKNNRFPFALGRARRNMKKPRGAITILLRLVHTGIFVLLQDEVRQSLDKKRIVIKTGGGL